MGSGIYSPSPPEGPLRQGEILSDLKQPIPRSAYHNSEEIVVDFIEHPYAIVVSQDCDLDWDYKARQEEGKTSKLLPNILLCEVMTAQNLRNNSDIKSNIWQRIRINKDERYHFLQTIPPEEDALLQGIPELGIDFKRYFTLRTDEVYAALTSNTAQRRSRLISPYLEHLSTRFAYYQFRVALPSDHESEPV